MRRFPRPLRACEAVLLGTLASNAARADNGPTVITGVFCDTEAQIASFAEAHLGAQLSVLEATRAIYGAMSVIMVAHSRSRWSSDLPLDRNS